MLLVEMKVYKTITEIDLESRQSFMKILLGIMAYAIANSSLNESREGYERCV